MLCANKVTEKRQEYINGSIISIFGSFFVGASASVDEPVIDEFAMI